MSKKREESKNSFLSIITRYLILLLVALPNLWLFYFVFAPLTIYPTYFLFDIFFDISLSGHIISVSECFPLEIVGACIAGAAYYLLLILNLSIPNIKLGKRLKMILFAFSILLIANILRIFILGLIFVGGFSWFDITHKIFWYFLSTIFVVVIWFTEVKLFKIKDIPVYSDIRYLYKNSILKK
ncbi:hypothetical protein BMS3Abin17_00717 [archaeon BMS3Abin17]|nr:hypothetical protein BMS3Abin17_00717 [archaeon BMS3Abin17]HDZ61030.1 pacearchaeosortase [Candidatus Pacearchaeota archaeon]